MNLPWNGTMWASFQRKQLKVFAENLRLRQVGNDDHIVPHKGRVTLICTQILVRYKLKYLQKN